MPVSLRQLSVFQLLMQTQSVTETANRLRITQPAVSKMLAQLEETLGLVLFHRSHGRLHPGPDAERIYIEASRLLEQAATFDQNVTSIRAADRGRLRIAAIPTLAAGIVSSAIGSFTRKHANVQVEVLAVNADQVIREVLLHRVEFGVVHQVSDDRNLRDHIIGETEMVCVLRSDHPLARRKRVTPKDLCNQNIVLLNTVVPSSQQVLSIFRKHGVEVRVAVETNMSYAAKSIARSGAGAALIDPWPTALAPEADLATLAFRPKVSLHINCLQSIYQPPSRLGTEFLRTLEAEVRDFANRSPFITAALTNKTA